jgi:hypothetical protein
MAGSKHCEDYEEVVTHRRIRCKHCRLLICRWCYGHTHGLVALLQCKFTKKPEK